MVQVVIGVFVIFILYMMFKGDNKPKTIEEKEVELKEVKLAHKVLDIEEQIVDSAISLKERNEELKSKKEKVEDAK